MLIRNFVAITLTEPRAANWWASAREVALKDQLDLGQLKVTIYKASDGFLHTYAKAEIEELEARAVTPLHGIRTDPKALFLRWNEDELRLRLPGHQTQVVPWTKVSPKEATATNDGSA